MPGAGRYMPIEGINEILKLAAREVDPATHSMIEDKLMPLKAHGHLHMLRALRMHPLIYTIDTHAAYDAFYACAKMVYDRSGPLVALVSISGAISTISMLNIPDGWKNRTNLTILLRDVCSLILDNKSLTDASIEQRLKIVLNTTIVTLDPEIELDTSTMVDTLEKTLLEADDRARNHPSVMFAARAVYRRCIFVLESASIQEKELDSNVSAIEEMIGKAFRFNKNKDANFMSIDSYVVTNVTVARLGGGSFGTVYAVPSADNDGFRAVKTTTRVNPRDIIRFVRDYELTRALHALRKESFAKTFCMFVYHPGVFDENNDKQVPPTILPTITSELAKYGDLRYVTENASNLYNNRGDDVLRDVAKNIAFATWIAIIPAMRAMHDMGYVHCDIRLQNIFVFENSIKLCDLDMCKDMREDNMGLFNEHAVKMSKRVHRNVDSLVDEYIDNYCNNRPTDGKKWYYSNYPCTYAPETLAGNVRANSDGRSTLREIDVWSVGYMWHVICTILFGKVRVPYKAEEFGNLIRFSAFPNTRIPNHQASIPHLSNKEDAELSNALRDCFKPYGRSEDRLWKVVEKNDCNLYKNILTEGLRVPAKKTLDQLAHEQMKKLTDNIVSIDDLNPHIFVYERTDLDDRMALSN